MTLTRRRFVQSVGSMGAALTARPVLAQTYSGPQPIKVIVPFAPGGTTDITGRLLAERLSTLWGATFIVENVAGAQGNIGMDRVAKSPADGTSVLICTPAIVTNQFLYGKLSFDPEKDFVPVTQVVTIPNLLVVKKDLPVGSVKDLIAYAKANPGKLNYASPGVGSSIHLAAEIFKRMTGTDMAHVAYRGSGPALNDLVAGNVDLIFENISSCINLVRQGQLKGIAVTSAKRSSLASDFPAIAETVPGFDVSSFFGVAVKTGTPPGFIARLERDTIQVCREPAVKEKLAAIVAETVGQPQAEFAAFLARERARWGKLITELNIKAG
jgi:tripartite-type tricarboxylate transporter receptor subunit TctC